MIKIEDYKGFEIFYNEDSDKFATTMELNNSVKESKRSSLKALKQEINNFVKLNLEFKPFWILENYHDSATPKYVSAIRTDGTFVVSSSDKDNKWSSYIDINTLKKSFVFSQSYLNQLKDIDLQLDKLRQLRSKTEKELKAKLIPLDLSKYE